MPLVPNNLVVKLVARGYCEGQEVINDTHWRVAGGAVWTAIQMQSLGAAYIDWWGSNVQALTVAGYVMSEVVVTQQIVGGLQEIVTSGLPLSGSLVGDALPLNIAACITFATGRSGRSGRGRYYLGCLGELSTTASRFTAPFVTAVNTAFAALTLLDSPLAGEQFQLVVYSTVFNKVARLAGVPTAVTSAYLRDNVVDSQRRRLPGRGR